MAHPVYIVLAWSRVLDKVPQIGLIFNVRAMNNILVLFLPDAFPGSPPSSNGSGPQPGSIREQQFQRG